MPKPQQNPLVELDAVMDLFGRPAGWMLYWGNTAIFLLFALLIGLAAWISYPDKVELGVQISTPHPPALLVTPMSGVISDVFFTEGKRVKIDQNILLFDNPAAKKDIELLDLSLTKIQALQQATDIFTIDLNENLDVGELGPQYAELLNYATTLKYWLERSSQGKRARRLNLQFAQRQEQAKHLLEQLEQLELEKNIAERNQQQYTDLLTKGAASQAEADQAASHLLQAKRALKAQENLMIQNQIQTESLELEKIRLAEQLSDQITQQYLAFKHQQRSLRQALNNWKDRYLIKAKTAGIITYFQPLSRGQYLEVGHSIGSIIPADTATLTYVAEGYLSSQAIGRIHKGQTVLIALDAYPYREFGQLKGQVAQLALAPAKQNDQTSGYRIVIDLPQSLLSTYDRQLPFRQQLSGRATIITEDRSFLNRILDRFRDLNNT